ncbi:MAG TPA: APC family permease [Opitutaceae bacterium]
MPPGTGSLRRDCVSFVENLAQTVGSMAPSGGLTMFIPLVFATAGNGTWLLYVPVAAGYMLLAANINAFTSRTASAGSFATFAELGLGRTAGLIAGWTYFASLLFAVADCAPSVAFYSVQAASQFGVHLSTAAALALEAGAVVAAWWAARRDISLSTNLMLGVECLSLGTIAALAILFVAHTGRWLDVDQFHLAGVHTRGMRLGIIMAFMSLTGFESVTALGEESRHALKAIPRAILFCILPISLLYLLMAYIVVMAFKGSGLDLGQVLVPFNYLAQAAGWPHLSRIVAIGIVLSFFACLLGCMNAGARVMFALARDGQFFRAFGVAHARNATPHRAIDLIGIFALVVPLGLAFAGMKAEDAMAYGAQLASLGFVTTYIWVCVSAPVYLRRLGSLTWRRAAASVVAFAIFGLALAASIYPAPPYPWNTLPYIFVVTVAAAVVLSWTLRLRARSTRLPEPTAEKASQVGVRT